MFKLLKHMYILYMYYVSEKNEPKMKMINENYKPKTKTINENYKRKIKTKKGKPIPLDFPSYQVIIVTLIYLYLPFVLWLFVLRLLQLHK